MNQMDRRCFLRLSGMLGVGLAVGGLVPAGAEAVKFDRRRFKVSETRLTMGTFVSMTLIHDSRDRAEKAMGRAFEEIERLTRLFNRFDETTALGLLNREGLLRDVPPEVEEVVREGLHYHRISGGSFDISVKPVVDLFRERFAGGVTPPDPAEMDRALALVGSDKIRVENGRIRFLKPGMGITLDGIAKGYIVDRASQVLAERGIDNHLINAGGDIRTRGARADGKPWAVAVQDPEKRAHYPAVVHMSNGAVATSGDYEVYFDREKMFHHIVNPKTGLSPHHSSSVTVLAPTAMRADALSTSVFVMPPRRGAAFVDRLPICECLILTHRGNRIRSAGWARKTT